MKDSSESMPQALADATLAALCQRLAAREVHGSDGGPLMTLVSQMGPDPVGHVRVFESAAAPQVVTISLVVPQIGVDSHMIFAFTAVDSAIPHFTLDSVYAGGNYAFHLDLIPRADLGAHLAYMDGMYGPLTEHFDAASKIDGLVPAHLSPRQRALMSPWMLANRATDHAFARIDTPVRAYLEHWFGLVEGGAPAAALADVDPSTLGVRDARNRAALFNPDVDPVWAQVGRLVGEDTAERMRGILRGD